MSLSLILLYLTSMLVDLLSVFIALLISDFLVSRKTGSLKMAAYASIATVAVWRVSEFVFATIGFFSAFFVTAVLVVTFAYFVNRFYGDSWIIIFSLALILIFFFHIMTSLALVVIRVWFH